MIVGCSPLASCGFISGVYCVIMMCHTVSFRVQLSSVSGISQSAPEVCGLT